MTAGASFVLVIGAVGLLAASATRRWAQRITRGDALLRRLRGDAAVGTFQIGIVADHRRGRGLVVLTPMLGVVPGFAAGVGGFALVLGVAGTVAVLLVQEALRRRDPARYERVLMVSLDGLARQLRSGASLHAGLSQVADEAVGPLREDLWMVHSAMAQGELLSDALHRWAEHRPMPAVRRVVGGLGVGHESGALRARHVEALADGLRQDHHVRREAESWAAQAQASALIMVVSPLAFSMLLATGDQAVRRFLVHQPLGLACLSIGLGLDLGAAAIMNRMVAVVR